MTKLSLAWGHTAATNSISNFINEFGSSNKNERTCDLFMFGGKNEIIFQFMKKFSFVSKPKNE